MPVDEDTRLAMHYYAGGIYNILMDWLKSDRKDEEWVVDKIITLTDNDTIAEGLTQYTALYKKLDWASFSLFCLFESDEPVIVDLDRVCIG